MSAIIHLQKSDFSLPIIQVFHCDIVKISDELKCYVPNDAHDFFSVPCVLSIEADNSEPAFLAQLVEVLRQLNFLPIGLKTEDESLFEQAHYAGLAIFNEKMNQLDLFEVALSNQSDAENLRSSSEQTPPPYTYHQNVYAGEQLYAEGCDLIVLGDVELGAEVIADGNIYIGGSLNGKAYAGNSGFMNIDEITIRAYVFEPELISIAGFYQLKEDLPEQYIGLSVKTRFVSQKFEYSLE